MAQDGHAQSHDSASISWAQEAKDTSSSLPAVVSASTVTQTATPSPATSTPSATPSTSSTLAAPIVAATAAPTAVPLEPASATPTSLSEPVAAPFAVTVNVTAAASTSPGTATATAPTPPLPQNGDSRAAAPESSPTLDTEMSSQHPGAPHGQPVSYPGPANPYPSAVGVSAAHYGSYPAVSQPGDYRTNPVPVGSNVMSLPSMRTMDSLSSQPGPPGAGPQAMSMGMPMAPVQPGVPFYGHHNMTLASGYGLPSDPMARYALPHDPRLLARGSKKEIKRRTKTGCLTCRKRRIKCDETHPTCNNCKKSKRECLGYDPIFRQQPGNPAASHLQPAPNQNPNASVPSSLPPAIPSSLPSNPPLTARAANSYGNQPSMLPSSYAPAHISTVSPSLPQASLYGQVKQEQGYHVKAEPSYEYASAIDPALQTLPSVTQDSSRLLDHEALVDNSLHLRAKMQLDEIINQLGPAPAPQQGAPTEEMALEIAKVYHEIYAPGLSSFFETNWYFFVNKGQTWFPRNPELLGLVGAFLKILEEAKPEDQSQTDSSGILETRIVWDLARLPFKELPSESEAEKAQEAVTVAEAKNRVLVIEALLCGEHLDTNPLPTPPLQHEPHDNRQRDFWYNLADFVLSRDDPNSEQAIEARELALVRLRKVLGGRENRDLLYSIAVVRHLAPNYEPGYGAALPYHMDETDPKNRLAVATKFILSEAQVTGGTTNVVRRFSDLASRAFVNPGLCIGRRP